MMRRGVFTVLFVCTGNTCRSPMAAAVLKDRLEAEDGRWARRVHVVSAGVGALPETPASPDAVHLLDERGIDLSQHTARPLTSYLVREADLILTMTREQKRRVLMMSPEVEGKTFTLKEFVELEHWQEVTREAEEWFGRLLEKRDEFYEEHGEEMRQLRRQWDDDTSTDRRGEIETQLAEREEEATAAVSSEREHLRELDDRLMALDIADPFGSGGEAYDEVLDEIADAVEKLALRLNDQVEDALAERESSRGGKA